MDTTTSNRTNIWKIHESSQFFYFWISGLVSYVKVLISTQRKMVKTQNPDQRISLTKKLWRFILFSFCQKIQSQVESNYQKNMIQFMNSIKFSNFYFTKSKVKLKFFEKHLFVIALDLRAHFGKVFVLCKKNKLTLANQ